MGKVMPEPTPFLNEWWKVAFSVTPRGLTTDTIASGDEAFAIDFDFIDYNLFIHTSDGRTKALPLLPRSIADFYAEFLATLGVLGIEGAINPVPVEIPNPVRCDLDHHHGAYAVRSTSTTGGGSWSSSSRSCSGTALSLRRQEQPGHVLLGLVRPHRGPCHGMFGITAGGSATLHAARRGPGKRRRRFLAGQRQPRRGNL
jgi:hypothetical protein